MSGQRAATLSLNMAVAGGSRRPAAQGFPSLGLKCACRGGGAHRAWPSTSLCGRDSTVKPGGGHTWESSLQASKLTPNPPNLTVATLPWNQECPSLQDGTLPQHVGLPTGGEHLPVQPGPLLQGPSLIPKESLISKAPQNPCCRPPSAPEIPGAGASAPPSSRGSKALQVLQDPTDWALSKHSCKHRCVALRQLSGWGCQTTGSEAGQGRGTLDV